MWHHRPASSWRGQSQQKGRPEGRPCSRLTIYTAGERARQSLVYRTYERVEISYVLNIKIKTNLHPRLEVDHFQRDRPPGVEGDYNRAGLLAKRRLLMADWATFALSAT
jgi:hypothetical protein